MIGRVFPLALAFVAAVPAAAQDWHQQYQVGDAVEFTISGERGDFQPCVVTENDPGLSLRVRCDAFKHWSEGVYIVFGKEDIRKRGGGAPANAGRPAPPPPGIAPPPTPGRQPETSGKWAGYAIGDQVLFTISGSKGDLQPCTVAEIDDVGLMRVDCGDFKHWGAERYIASDPKTVVRGNAPPPPPAQRPVAAAPPPQTQPGPPAVAAAPPPPAATGPGKLAPGEYACVGAGGRHIPGLGFNLAADGRYTNLDGTESGRVTASAAGIRFTGGQLDGQVGRWIDATSFALGQVQCAPYR